MTTPGVLTPEQVLNLAREQKAKALGPAISEGPATSPILLPGESTTDKPGEHTLDPLQNPAAAQALADAAMGKDDENKPIVVSRPPVDTIELPAGWLDRDGRLHRTAKIRELRGSDEEELAKPYQRTAAAFVDTIVSRCTVDIGGHKLSQNDLRQLLTGDRDAIVIGVRILTYGPKVTMPVKCPNFECRHDFTVEVNLESDIPQKELPFDPKESRTREMTLPRGEIVKVNLIDGAVQLAAYNTEEDFNDSERVSIVLKECIYSINDEYVTSIDQVRELSSSARRAIGAFLGENSCGPQWGAVEQKCPNCQAVNTLPLTLVGLFL